MVSNALLEVWRGGGGQPDATLWKCLEEQFNELIGYNTDRQTEWPWGWQHSNFWLDFWESSFFICSNSKYFINHKGRLNVVSDLFRFFKELLKMVMLCHCCISSSACYPDEHGGIYIRWLVLFIFNVHQSFFKYQHLFGLPCLPSLVMSSYQPGDHSWF